MPEDNKYKEDDGSNLELAQWLQDSGRRRAICLKESPEELLKYLEELTGEKLSSREHILAYFGKLRIQKTERLASQEKRRSAREIVLVTLLALALAQFYFWDVNLQIALAKTMHFFVPAPPQAPGKQTERSYVVLNS